MSKLGILSSPLVLFICSVLLLLLGFACCDTISTKRYRNGYACVNDKCVIADDSSGYSFYECRMVCGNEIGTLWPKPNGAVTYSKEVSAFDVSKIVINAPPLDEWNGAKALFLQRIRSKTGGNDGLTKSMGTSLNISISHGTPKTDLLLSQDLNVDESYQLEITSAEKQINVNIKAISFFGARHAMETIVQLIYFDETSEEMKILGNVKIEDAPKYKWRGLMVDTARNFISTTTIKKILDGMALSKMNTFHWHITDSQSFPFEVKSLPELTLLGAYNKKKIYRQEEIVDIIKYALVRGIRVIPELDAPAHVGEGWQAFNVLSCFRNQPWQQFCVEPPCGQFDPTRPQLYELLKKVYREMLGVFKSDLFHMGGDEVSVNCWNATETIQEWMLTKGWSLKESDFMQLWNYFQTEALKTLDSVSGDKKTIILWTSRLTERPYIDLYLNPDRYIIQTWAQKGDIKNTQLLEKGYRTIISYYDLLYLDCGGAGWVTNGQNWCSPYIGWQKIYENGFDNIKRDFNDLVLGAEAAVWTEQIDDSTILPRIFPRVSALAEILWSGDGSWKAAESRMLLHRRLLVENNIDSEPLQPEWCLQNENHCPI